MSQCIAEVNETDILDSLFALSSRIVSGATLDESLEFVFDSFENIIPYDRIGFAEIDNERSRVRARWTKSRGEAQLKTGYSAPLQGSSLSIVLEHRQPRILNDLTEYLERRPQSCSTALIVREGLRSSITWPLYLRDVPYGFLFFSSCQTGVYTDTHVKILKETGNLLAMLLLVSQQRISVAHEHVAEAISEPKMRESTLSGLRPGMVVAAPLKLSNGQLLIAEGVTLSTQIISRLINLHKQGFTTINAVMVR